MVRSILWILGFGAVIAVIYFVLGDALGETIDANNTAQLVRVGGAFALSLALMGGFTAAAFAAFVKRS